MKGEQRFIRWKPVASTAGLALLLGLLMSWLDGGLLGLEDRSLDYRFQLRGPRELEHSPLILVQVDNRSYKDLDERFPFPREHYARVIRNLKAAGVAAVVMDIQFTERVSGNQTGLEELVQAVGAASPDSGVPVILAGKVERELRGYSWVDYPLEELLGTGQPWGLVNTIMDRDGVHRLYSLFQPDPLGEKKLPSIGLQTFLTEVDAQAAAQAPGKLIDTETEGLLRVGPREIRLEPGFANTFRINFYGPSGSFPTYSFSDIMDDAGFDLSHPDLDTDYMEQWSDPELYELIWGDAPHPFRGKIALIGVSADDQHDNKVTPFFQYGGTRRLMPGVEIHAHAIQNIFDGIDVHPALPGWLWLLPLILLALIGSLTVHWLTPLRCLVLLAPLALGWLWLALVLFTRHNAWLEVVNPLTAFAGAWVTGVLQHFMQARRERAQIRGMFAQYVPEAVVSELIADPEKLVLGGEEREMSSMFSDVAGFTSISEQLTPHQLVELLNEFLTEMTECIYAEGGIIDKYEGDAIIAEFGAPIAYEDHALRACRAAVVMQKRLAELREIWESRGQPRLQARVGVNSGPMVVGNMGSRQIFDYTVIGDAVNLASRLEGVNKFYGSWILVSEFTWRRVENEFLGRRLDLIRVKGKLEPVGIYEILDLAAAEGAGELRERCRIYDEAFAGYLARDFRGAGEGFAGIHERWPGDAPASVMRERCSLYLESPPPEDWDGVMTMTEK